MKAEKIVISFVAMIIGIIVAGIGFYVYQSQHTIPPSAIKTIIVRNPSPTPKSNIALTIDTPQNEDVVSSKTLTVTGKTVSDAVVTLTTSGDSEVVSPASNGNFSADLTLSGGENVLEITATLPDGRETTVKRTITYSTEEF